MHRIMDNYTIPLPALHALGKLGRDIHDARRRRRLPAALFAERASISRTTLHKVERGDTGVSAGAYAKVLFVLGMERRLADLVDPQHDTVGLELEKDRLPKRIRLPKRKAD